VETAFTKMSTQNKKEFYAQLNSEVSKIVEELKTALSTGVVKKADEWK
jgi:hypothetical protein